MYHYYLPTVKYPVFTVIERYKNTVVVNTTNMTNVFSDFQNDYVIEYYNASASGINDNQLAALNIYPNPAVISFKVNVAEKGTLEIMSVDGKLLHTQQINALTEINTNDWEKGMYMIRFVNENGQVSVQKLIVE